MRNGVFLLWLILISVLCAAFVMWTRANSYRDTIVFSRALDYVGQLNASVMTLHCHSGDCSVVTADHKAIAFTCDVDGCQLGCGK